MSPKNPNQADHPEFQSDPSNPHAAQANIPPNEKVEAVLQRLLEKIIKDEATKRAIEGIVPVNKAIPRSHILKEHFDCIPGVLQIISLLTEARLSPSFIMDAQIKFITPLTEGTTISIEEKETATYSITSTDENGNIIEHCVITKSPSQSEKFSSENMSQSGFTYNDTPVDHTQHELLSEQKTQELIPHKGSFLFTKSVAVHNPAFKESAAILEEFVAGIFPMKHGLRPEMLIEIGGQGIVAAIQKCVVDESEKIAQEKYEKDRIAFFALSAEEQENAKKPEMKTAEPGIPVIEALENIEFNQENIDTLQAGSVIISRGHSIQENKRHRTGVLEVYAENSDNSVLPLLRLNFNVQLLPKKLYERMKR